jgi:MFS family permease
LGSVGHGEDDRSSEGRSRVGALSLGATIWVVACLLAVLAQIGSPGVAFAVLLVAAAGIAVGECLHATAFIPLIADLAPPALRGRYMATVGLSWWLGLALAPTVGGQLLAVSPSLPLIGGAGLAAAVVVLLRSSESKLPIAARSIPQPDRHPDLEPAEQGGV